MNNLIDWYLQQVGKKPAAVQIATIPDGGWWLRVDMDLRELDCVAQHLHQIVDTRLTAPSDWLDIYILKQAVIGTCAPHRIGDWMEIFLNAWKAGHPNCNNS